jgi:DNA-binding response OmpR family regulator
MSIASGAREPVAGRRLLVVEDEPTIADAVATRLRAEGYTVDLAADGPTAVAAALEHRPDALVLDVMLPGFDGLEVCRRVQAAYPVPVLMLTARDDEADLLVGLGVGADDYLTKPFSMRELVGPGQRPAAPGRPRACAGRVRPCLGTDHPRGRSWSTGPSAGCAAAARPCTSPRSSSTCWCASPPAPRVVLSRETLLADVWDWADASGTRTVDSHIKALRRKLGPGLIRTVHGIGYSADPTASGEDHSDEPGDLT